MAGMNRTRRYKLGYLVAICTVGALAWWLFASMGQTTTAFLLVVVVLIVPGRFVGYFYRDLFRARRLLEAGRVEESAEHSRLFIEYVRRHPRLKRLIWLSWPIYTPDPEAMAWNNLGIARLQTGNFASASEAFRTALELDPEYPLPHYNQAMERTLAGDQVGAARCLEQAIRLGYRRTTIDQVLHAAAAVLARLEGQGISLPSQGTNDRSD